jgi:hypothetical protein
MYLPLIMERTARVVNPSKEGEDGLAAELVD